MPKRRSAVQPLPPGTYVATVQSVRKVRNKDAFRMTLAVGEHVLTDTIYAGAPKGRK